MHAPAPAPAPALCMCAHACVWVRVGSVLVRGAHRVYVHARADVCVCGLLIRSKWVQARSMELTAVVPGVRAAPIPGSAHSDD